MYTYTSVRLARRRGGKVGSEQKAKASMLCCSMPSHARAVKVSKEGRVMYAAGLLSSVVVSV